jgi:protoporphyrinogen oxidase
MNNRTISIIGGGFTGLSLGYYLSKSGWIVNIFEKDADIAGLAGSFSIGDSKLEKFYHHWFTNDVYINEIVKDLKLEKNLKIRPTKTGMYFANKFFKLSTPFDLLNFNPLNIFQRLRLGLVVVAVRFVSNWMSLENITARDWLIKICGKKGYSIVWEPLLKGKFGKYSDDVSAVWFWNKLKLRGGSRSENGAESLLYYDGGFASLADSIKNSIEANNGKVHCNSEVLELISNSEIKLKNGTIHKSDHIVLTTPLPICAHLLSKIQPPEYIQMLNKIVYLGNVCLVLELTTSLSDLYWINVNEPNFPFVGVIEHTNFEPKESYGGKHIVYLSKYLPTDEALYNLSREEFYEFSIPYIKQMFPDFDEKIVSNYYLWKELYSQPLVTKNYSQFIANLQPKLQNVYINTMAQIYPEDRGTNYAIREGKKMAEMLDKL